MRSIFQHTFPITHGILFFLAATGIIGTTFAADATSNSTSAVEQPLLTGMLKSREDLEKMFAEPIARLLATGGRNLNEWADELEKTAAKTPKELWTKYEVCLRAGRHETAIQLMPVLLDVIESVELRSFFDAQPKFQFYNNVYKPIQELKNNPHQIELYTAFYDVFAPVYCYTLPLEEFKKAGWSDEKITDWLRKHYESALAYKPVQTGWSWSNMSSFHASPYVSLTVLTWQEQYLRHLADLAWKIQGPINNPERIKFIREEWNRLASEAEKNPGDMAKLTLLFQALRRPFHQEWIADLPKLDWLAKTVEKRTAFEAWYIATSLYSMRANDKVRKDYLELSLPFWRRALDIPLTDEQCAQIYEENSRYSAIRLPPRDDAQTRAAFRAKIFDPLNQTLLLLERTEEAQAVMEEGRLFRQEHRLGNNPVLAGATQLASGYRVVEADILSREPVQENNEKTDAAKFAEEVKYWKERADYYLGRGELEQQEDALRRGLALFSTPERRASHHFQFHDYYRDLLNLFAQAKRTDDALKLFHEIHAMTEGETQNRAALYDLFFLVFQRLGEEKVVGEKWRQDLETCVAKIKTRQEKNSEPPSTFDDLNSLMSAPIAHDRPALKFDNTDPLWWEVLPLLVPHNRKKMMQILVLQADHFYDSSGKTTLDEKALEKARQFVLHDENDMPELQGLRDLAWMLFQSGHATLALPLWETALERAEEKHVQLLVRLNLCETYLKLGDWRRTEKTLDECIASGWYEGDYVIRCLQALRKLAEEAGAVQDALRIQKRLENLGVQF